MCNIIKNSVLEVSDNVIKQQPRSKAKYWLNQNYAEAIELRNNSILQMFQYPTRINIELYEKRRKETYKIVRYEKKQMKRGK